jgi:GNAT superfamily N-acetyltransferase
MLIEVRRAMAEDISRVLKFYAERRYGGGIRPEDALLLAEYDGELIGIVRLTTEEGVVGMQVHPRFQRQGIGKRLLAAVALPRIVNISVSHMERSNVISVL